MRNVMMSQFWDDVYHMRSLSIFGLFIQSQGREVTQSLTFLPTTQQHH